MEINEEEVCVNVSIIISILTFSILILLALLAIHFHRYSKQQIAKRVTMENMLVLAMVYGIVSIGFALLYFWMHLADLGPLHFSNNVPNTVKLYFLDSLYFSIATLFTVGYGDITPVGYGRVAAIIEIMLGYVLSGAIVVNWTSSLKR
jgi:potassium channel LctB